MYKKEEWHSEPIVSEQGKILAHCASLEKEAGLIRFVALIKFGKGKNAECEEIDVDAINKSFARQMVKRELENGYAGRGRIAQIEPVIGLY